MSYDDWKTDSGREDDFTPRFYSVHCIACGRPFYVRADERPPYRCEGCIEGAAIRDQRTRAVA